MDALNDPRIRPDPRIHPDDPMAAGPAAVIARHLEAMQSYSPPDSVHAKDGHGLAAPDVQFFALRLGDEVAAIGALQALSPEHGELKSMHVPAERRGEGHGQAMLRHLMYVAVAQGMTRLSLETGSAPVFAAARALYARHGFEDCAPFADYVPDRHSVFMTRSL